MKRLHDDEILWEEFQNYFTAFVVNDVKKSLEFGIEVGTIILTTIGIECLGGYYAGKETERKYFVKFMQDFMHKYGDFADDIYECIRNGLAHDFVVKENKANHRKFIITGKQGEKHLSPHPVNSNVFFLNRDAYARDFLIAQKNYFKKVENDQFLWDNAMKRVHHQKGFLTVRPEIQFITDNSSEVNFGTLSKPNTKNLSTGTYSTENPYDD